MSHRTIRRRRCPRLDCRSNREDLRPKLVLHSCFKTSRGPRRRLRCKHCGRTFAVSKGTAYYRLRRSRAAFDRAIALVLEGLGTTAIARSQGLSPSTVARWRSRAGAHAWRFTEEHLKIHGAVELQFDELRGRGAASEKRTWVYGAIEVWSRVWAGWHVAPRSQRATTMIARDVRDRISPIVEPLVCSTDPMKYYARSIRRTFSCSAAHVQVKNSYRRGRLVRTRSTVVWNPGWRFERARDRSEDSKKPNTAYIERLNLFVRRSCSYLQRRTNGPARRRVPMAESLAILQCYYNFSRRHSSLRLGRERRTPAMQAGIFRRPVRLREILSWVPKPTDPSVRLPISWSDRQSACRGEINNT